MMSLGRKEMARLLEWLEEDEWTQYTGARNSRGAPVAPASLEAEMWDLTCAIEISFRRDEVDRKFDAIRRIKRAYKILFPDYWAANVMENGREPPLYKLNDELTSFEEVKRLLSMA